MPSRPSPSARSCFARKDCALTFFDYRYFFPVFFGRAFVQDGFILFLNIAELCSGGFMSGRGYVREGLCPGGVISGRLCVREGLCPEELYPGGVMSGRYFVYTSPRIRCQPGEP